MAVDGVEHGGRRSRTRGTGVEVDGAAQATAVGSSGAVLTGVGWMAGRSS